MATRREAESPDYVRSAMSETPLIRARGNQWLRRVGSSAFRLPVCVAEFLLLLVLVVFFVRDGFLPGWRSLAGDFSSYILAGRLYREGYPVERFYDWTWFQRQKDHAGSQAATALFTPWTPFSVLPVVPLSSMPFLEAKRCWLIINLILLAIIIDVLSGMTKLGLRRTALLAFLAIYPLQMHFFSGQYHLLILLLLIVALWLYLNDWPATAGVVLASAAALKIYPGLCLFYFIRKKQWRAAAGLALGSVGFAILGVALFGFQTNRLYLMQILPRTLIGENLSPYSAYLNTSVAVLHRLFIREPEWNPQPWIHAPEVYAFLQPLFQALLFVPFLWLISPFRSDPTREKFEWGAYVSLLLVISTSPAAFHYCVLVLTAVFAADFLRQSRRWVALGIVLVTYAAVCFPPDLYLRWVAKYPAAWQRVLPFPRFYSMLVLSALLLWILASERPQGFTPRILSREGAAFGLLFLIMVAAGEWSHLRHFRGLFDSYSSRITPVSDWFSASQPAVAREGIFFTARMPQGYVMHRLTHGVVNALDFGVDAFSPSAPVGLSEGWAELASTRSRIVRFPLEATMPPASRLPVEAEDAERPSVSPDGQWLGFIRETKGRGSLWVKDLRAVRSDAPQGAIEWEVVPGSYDVLEAGFFPDHRVAFAGQPDGQPRLFVVDPVSRLVTSLTAHQQRERYPAVSPDGHWLAYSKEENGGWNLWLKNLITGGERPLTGGDCSSISPAWHPDSKTLVYATDCGRGLALPALCRIQAVP